MFEGTLTLMAEYLFPLSPVSPRRHRSITVYSCSDDSEPDVVVPVPQQRRRTAVPLSVFIQQQRIQPQDLQEHRKWTDQEDCVLMECVNKGIPYSKIPSILGTDRTWIACRSRVGRILAASRAKKKKLSDCDSTDSDSEPEIKRRKLCPLDPNLPLTPPFYK